MGEKYLGEKSVGKKSFGENRGRWDAGFRFPPFSGSFFNSAFAHPFPVQVAEIWCS